MEPAGFPFELAREAVINAFVHRDYDLVGATCHLVVTADTVTVRSPGAHWLRSPWRRCRNSPRRCITGTQSCNSHLAERGLWKGAGLGMRTFGEAADRYGLPGPKYSFDGLYLNLTIYRNRAAAVSTLSREILASLSKAELTGWEWLSTQEQTTSSQYSDAVKIPNRTALRQLKRFTESGSFEEPAQAPRLFIT